MSPDNWNLVVCGASHKTSSIKEREPLQIGRDEIARANALFGGIPGVMESAIVSTCNRIEFYFTADNRENPLDLIKSFYRKFRNQETAGGDSIFFIKKNKHAAAHLLGVASGIDSMIIGENQILGQIKDAYSSACAVRTAGKVIHRLFHQAFRVGKQVRTDTEMGKGACSVSSAAIELLEAKINNLSKPNVLIIGINQMTALAAAGVARLDYGTLYIANRTVEKARAFAVKYNAEYAGLDQISGLLNKVDIVISCTGAESPIITEKTIRAHLAGSPTGKLLMIDLAIPRDIEFEKGSTPNIELYDLEDIKKHVEEHRQKRELALPQAHEIIDRKLSEFIYWFEHIRFEPFYNGLDDVFESIRREELAEVISRLAPDERDEIERATKRIVTKLLQLKVRTSG